VFMGTTKYENGSSMAAIHNFISPFRKREVRRDFPPRKVISIRPVFS
jgi:hypothetical protein